MCEELLVPLLTRALILVSLWPLKGAKFLWIAPPLFDSRMNRLYAPIFCSENGPYVPARSVETLKLDLTLMVRKS